MIRRPPRSTRTDTLFPYTTLFRSTLSVAMGRRQQAPQNGAQRAPARLLLGNGLCGQQAHGAARRTLRSVGVVARRYPGASFPRGLQALGEGDRAEERRVGKESGRTGKARWCRDHKKKKTDKK